MRSRLAWLVLALVAACTPRPRPATPAPAPPAPAPVVTSVAIAATPAPPTRVAAAPTPRTTFFVGGCNVECVGCGIDAETYVRGTIDRVGRTLFAGPSAPGQPYSCAAAVPVGEEVTLTARTSGRVEFSHWRLFGSPYESDYCPCAGSTDPVCRFAITPEVADGHPRAYCGAVWKARSATAIAR